MEDFARYAMLLDFYGPLLPARQNQILDLHFNSDLSLAEIAEQTGISRQGVYDALKKGKSSLDRYEGVLGLSVRFARQTSLLREITDVLARDGSPETVRIRERIEELNRSYNDGAI